MRLRLLTITHKVPIWVKQGYEEYAKRMTHPYSIELIEIPAEKRQNKADIKKLTIKEGDKMLSLIKPQDLVIALDSQGMQFSSESLAQKLTEWQLLGNTVDFLIGGPQGLSPTCLQRAQLKYSLSLLTFPHFLVRIILAEQLYRAISLLQNHPYHK